MAAPSGIVWGSVSSNGKGKLGIYVSPTVSNTSVSLYVEVWLALKYNVNDSSNSYSFTYTNDSGTSVTNPNGTSLSLNFGTTSGSGWAEASQKMIASYTLSYTRGHSAKTISLSASLTGLGSDSYGVSASTSYSVAAKPAYTVSYSANGGSGAPSSQTKWYGETLTLSSTVPTRAGHSFGGWGTSSGDTSADYYAGSSYTGNSSITLYAIWIPYTYTVSYNANGGSGAPASQTKTYGVALKLSSTIPTRPNYNFLGWATTSTATAEAYSAGGSYTSNASVTLYAVWELAYTKPVITNVSVFRSDGEGKPSDSGENIVAQFDWSTFFDVTEILISWKKDSETNYLKSISVPASGKSGSVLTDPFGQTQNENEETGEITYDVISTDNVYDVRITVTDSGGNTPVEVSIPSMKFNFDMLPENKGASFGKAAEVENAVDFAFDILVRKGFNILVNYGESDQYNLLSRVGAKLDAFMQQISSLPTDTSNSFLFTCSAGVTCGSITIPQYSKGILICSYASSYDAVVIAVDASLNLYVGFRNYTTWYGRKI